MIKNIVEKFVENNAFDKYVIAYSGGVDSQVLLHAFSQVVPDKVVAFHVNHGISSNAQDWENFCSSTAAKLGVEFKVAHFHLKGETNLEDKARIARYGAFAEIMNKQTTLVTGHHIDDQVETLFLNLMRGAGLDGLSAMPSIKTFSSGFHSRPFLNISKEDLKAYAIENNISWVEDESNNDSVYDRNFIRNEVMPLIKTRWSNASQSITQSVEHIQNAKNYINTKVNELEMDCSADFLDIKELMLFNSYEQIETVRKWVSNHLGKSASQNMIKAIFNEIIPAKDDANMKWEQKNYFITRFNGKLYFVKKEVKQYDIAQLVKEAGIKLSFEELTVKSRVNGAKIKVNGGYHKEVKKIFQEMKIPHWERDSIPYIYFEDTLISVGGFINNPDYI
ncbi:MAG: tRNA lysidine(34) synthetase TilS [Silvanigrellaceae bacterium]|nr:tRNA lysidine(34) synthetase TilS [Silvanigrellaceae bacterium]